MADDFADAFKRYWLLIVTVAVGCIMAASLYVDLRSQIDAANAAWINYGSSRQLLLDGINDHFDRIDRRLDELERNRP